MNTFAKVANFCHQKLLQSNEVMEYVLHKRKINLESINKFEIGLFPQDLRELFEIINSKELRLAGIIKNASVSTFKTQNLVMPIRDVYGNYIAMAGRTLLSEQEREKHGIVKYINSVYKKSYHLFGFNFAKNSILKKNMVYVVEGYFDVIMPHQKGLENFVATCGAFLSIRHVALLSRYTNNIVIIMDNELEAQEKARKAVEKNNYEGINLTFYNPLQNDIEKDVDEFLRIHSVEDLSFRLESKEHYADIRPLWD
ncbi:MAG: toprim domain-containing protein [Patescibacteria group bacterium]